MRRSISAQIRCSRVRWLVLSMILLVYFITYIDRVNISVAAPTIVKDLHFSLTQMGVVFSAFSITYAILQIPGGWIGDKFGPRRALAGMGILWSLMTALTALPSTVLGFALVRAGLGVAEGGAFPTSTRALSAWIPSNQRGLAQGLPHSAARLGGAVTPPIVVALILGYGWRTAFVVLGVLSFLWVLLWIWLYRNRPREHWLTNDQEVEMLERTTVQGAQQDKPGPTPWGPLIRGMWPVTLTDFCYGWSLWVFLTWIPSYLTTARHFNLKQLALYATLPLLAGVIGDTLGGISSDALWQRGRHRLARAGQTALFLILSLAFVVPAVFTGSPVAAALLLSASFFCLEMTNAPLWALSMDIGQEHAGVAGGMMNTGFGIAGIISPIIFGALVQATGNWTLPFVVSSALLLIGAGVTYFIRPTGVLRRAEYQEQLKRPSVQPTG